MISLANNVIDLLNFKLSLLLGVVQYTGDVNSLGYRFLTFVTEEPVDKFDPNSVTPGPDGFFWTFLIAAATIFLIGDMSRRMRRNNLRAKAREELLREAESLLGHNSAEPAPGDDSESTDETRS